MARLVDPLISFLNLGGKQAFGTMNAMLDCVLGSTNTYVNSEHYAYALSDVFNIDNTSVERGLVAVAENCARTPKMNKAYDWETNSSQERSHEPFDEQQDTTSGRRVVESKPIVYCGKTFDEFDDHRLYSGSDEKAMNDHYSDALNNNELTLKEHNGNHHTDGNVGKYNPYETHIKYNIEERDRSCSESDDGSSYSDHGYSREYTSHSRGGTRYKTDRGSFSPHSGRQCGSPSPRRRSMSQTSHSNEQSWDYDGGRMARSRSPKYRASRSQSPTHRSCRSRRETSRSPRNQSHHDGTKRFYSQRHGGQHSKRDRFYSPGRRIHHSGREKCLSRGRSNDYPRHYVSRRSHSDDRSYKCERDGNMETNSRRKHYRTSKEPYQEYSKFNDERELDSVSDLSDISHDTDVFLNTHIDKWFSDFDLSEFSSDLEQSSNRKRKRHVEASIGDRDVTKTKKVKKAVDEKVVKSSKKSKNTKHKKNHQEKQTDKGMKPKSKSDELHDKSNKFVEKRTGSTNGKSDHQDALTRKSKNSKRSKREKRDDERIDDRKNDTNGKETSHKIGKRRQSTDSRSSRSRRNSTDDKEISDSPVEKCKVKGTISHTSKIKETIEPKAHHKRHSSPTRCTAAKRRKTRSQSQERSRSPSRSGSRSRSRSGSGSGQPPRRSHILDELYQLILAPTPG